MPALEGGLSTGRRYASGYKLSSCRKNYLYNMHIVGGYVLQSAGSIVKAHVLWSPS